MGKGKVCFGGIPTGPDVNRLVDAFKTQRGVISCLTFQQRF
jgi:hypothetical protein